MFAQGRRIPFLFVLFISLLSSCVNDIEKVKLLSSRVVEPLESASNIKMMLSDSAKLQVELSAPVLNHYATENPYVEMPKGLKATFYDNNMAVKSKITANYGIRYENEQKMEARKNVVVVNQKGDILNTEHLIWDERNEKLRSSEFVKITTKDQIIYGDGFEANQDFTKYKIFNIKGTITVNQNEHSAHS